MSDWADICEMYGHDLGDDADDIFESMGMFDKEWLEDDDDIQEEKIEVAIAGYRVLEVKTFSVMEVYDDGTEELLDDFDSEDKALECVREWNEKNIARK